MTPIVTETLYRKYRPQSFKEVIGQSQVVETLSQQIKSGSIAHAYLFSGGRGTGKTSIARIFAHELGTEETDLYEIDAASNRGINEIRELRDGVANLPFKSSYKVYLIDEVHMLTKEAFNALLKTLEEPPSHVIFILATTEKQKVLPTILSRCQVYDFQLATQEHLIKLIVRVAQSEDREIEEALLPHLARLGHGSFRDTLTHLQQIFARVTEKHITQENLTLESLNTHDDLENQLLQALSNKNQEAVFESYHALLSQSVDPTQLIHSLLDKIRMVLLLRNSQAYTTDASTTLTTEEREFFSNLPGLTSHTLRDLLGVSELVHRSARPQECLEIFLHEQFLPTAPST